MAKPESVDGATAGGLDPRAVHLWTADPERARDPEVLRACEKLLSEEERAAHRRLRRADSRQRFLVSRALVRSTLSRYAAVAPCEWRFARGAYGRPEIRAPARAGSLRFNLSHTRGLIACLVGRDRELGVDVEDTRRARDTEKLAARFLSPSEAAELWSQAEPAQRERFFDYWTLKESYLKARGLGLRIAPARLSFHVSEGRPIRVRFDPGLEDDPASWQFELRRPTPSHRVAVAIRRRGEPDLELRIHTWPGIAAVSDASFRT